MKMTLRKKNKAITDVRVSALFELLPEVSPVAFREWLIEHEASDVETLAPSMFSAVASEKTMKAAESLAVVQINRPKSTH